jgi:hypothetical protein
MLSSKITQNNGPRPRPAPKFRLTRQIGESTRQTGEWILTDAYFWVDK